MTVYIVDTGINVKHDEFQGRARWGKTIPDGDEDEDGNGHGSHVVRWFFFYRWMYKLKTKPITLFYRQEQLLERHLVLPRKLMLLLLKF